MKLMATTSQSSLTFHSDELTITDLHLFDNGESIEDSIAEVHIDFQRTFITLVLEATTQFTEGHEYDLETAYRADIERSGAFDYGFYHRPCSEQTNNHCWFTQFESTH